MKPAIVFLAALPLAAAPPLPGLRVEAAPAGSVIFVRNVYSQPLTAFIIELVDYPGSSFSRWADLAAGEGIPPGVEKSYPEKSMLVGAVSPEYLKVQAAIYTDGSTSGETEKIKQLIEWRVRRLAITRELIGRIEKSQSNGTRKADLVDELKQWQASIGPGPRHSPSAGEMIADAIRNLDKQSIDDVLSNLKRTEQVIGSSKPVLP
jgi:hypothetical protein